MEREFVSATGETGNIDMRSVQRELERQETRPVPQGRRDDEIRL